MNSVIHIDPPANSTFSIQRGADVALPLQFNQSDGTGVDFTGHTWLSEFETMDGTALTDEFTIDAADADTGLIVLQLGRSITSDSTKTPDKFRHKLWSTSASNKKRLWWYGTIQMRG